MAQNYHELTAEDFKALPWQTVPPNAGTLECRSYSRDFYRRATECDGQNDITGREAYILLGYCAGLELVASNPYEPFKAALITRTGRSASLEEVSEGDLRVLGQLAELTKDAEFRARLADICWVTRRDFRSAVLAVDAYLASADHLDSTGKWIEARYRLERALRLSAQLGNGGRPKHQAVIEQMETILGQHDAQDRNRDHQPAHLMELLLEFGAGDAVQLASLACQKAIQGDVSGGLGWEMAQRYWLLAAEWETQKGDTTAAQTARMRAADAFIAIAQEFLVRDVPDHLSATVYLQRAVEALRQFGESTRAEAVHRNLLQHQALAAAQMQSTSHEVDISEFSQRMIDAVKGRTLFESILVLVSSVSGPKVDALRRQATERSEDQLLIDLLATQERVDSKGRVVGRRPNRNADDPRVVEAAIEADMFDFALHYQHVIVAAQIQPAKYQINLDHRIQEVDLVSLLRYSPFVPTNREMLYATGLRAGFVGDYFLSTHLLIPQIEQSIRYLLDLRGVITSSMSSDGVQQDFDLGRLLGLAETRQMLGEDQTFDLRGLMVERFGSNLRNRVAHGLVDQHEFFSSHAVYLWWTALRLCFLPTLRSDAPADDKSRTG